MWHGLITMVQRTANYTCHKLDHGTGSSRERLLSGHGCCTEEGLPGPSHPDPSKDMGFLHSRAPGNLSTGTITGGRRRVSKETRNIFRFIPIWLKRGPQHRKISSRHQHLKSLTRIQTRCSVQKHPWGHIKGEENTKLLEGPIPIL